MNGEGLRDFDVTVSEVREVGEGDATCGLVRFPLLLPVRDWELPISVLDTAVSEEVFSGVASGTTAKSAEVAQDDFSFLSRSRIAGAAGGS